MQIRRLQHIHGHDVTSSLKENGGKKGFLDCSVYFLFFWKNKHRNRPNDARTVMWKDNVYSTGIGFNISAYGKEHP
jgi:hypothetical protein